MVSAVVAEASVDAGDAAEVCDGYVAATPREKAKRAFRFKAGLTRAEAGSKAVSVTFVTCLARRISVLNASIAAYCSAWHRKDDETTRSAASDLEWELLFWHSGCLREESERHQVLLDLQEPNSCESVGTAYLRAIAKARKLEPESVEQLDCLEHQVRRHAPEVQQLCGDADHSTQWALREMYIRTDLGCRREPPMETMR